MSPTTDAAPASAESATSGTQQERSTSPSNATVPETPSGPPSGDTSATQSSDDQSPPQVNTTSYHVLLNDLGLLTLRTFTI